MSAHEAMVECAMMANGARLATFINANDINYLSGLRKDNYGYWLGKFHEAPDLTRKRGSKENVFQECLIEKVRIQSSCP